MEFLKLVPAVTGRLVTAALDLEPSGHIEEIKGSVLYGGGVRDSVMSVVRGRFCGKEVVLGLWV